MRKGQKMSDEQRRKISLALKGKEKKYPVWNKGKKNIYSDEARKKMAYWKDKKMPNEIRKKMSKNHRTKRGYVSGMKGKKQSEYQKQKMSEVSKGNEWAKDSGPKKTSFKKGHIPWIKGGKHLEESKQKMSDTRRKLSKTYKTWKGDKAKKATIHDWVRTRRGRAREHHCELCGKQAVDWSNKDHKYSRNLDDYWALCRKCHREYDK